MLAHDAENWSNANARHNETLYTPQLHYLHYLEPSAALLALFQARHVHYLHYFKSFAALSALFLIRSALSTQFELFANCSQLGAQWI